MSLHSCGVQCPSPLKPLLLLGLAGGGAAARTVFMKLEFKFILFYVLHMCYRIPLPLKPLLFLGLAGGGAAARTVFQKPEFKCILCLYTPVVYNAHPPKTLLFLELAGGGTAARTVFS